MARDADRIQSICEHYGYALASDPNAYWTHSITADYARGYTPFEEQLKPLNEAKIRKYSQAPPKNENFSFLEFIEVVLAYAHSKDFPISGREIYCLKENNKETFFVAAALVMGDTKLCFFENDGLIHTEGRYVYSAANVPECRHSLDRIFGLAEAKPITHIIREPTAYDFPVDTRGLGASISEFVAHTLTNSQRHCTIVQRFRFKNTIAGLIANAVHAAVEREAMRQLEASASHRS